jgi:hypothetical protein
MGNYFKDNWLALTAIVFTVLNFIHTFYLGRRDNANLVSTCKFFKYKGPDGRGIKIHAVNTGRRPIVITSLTYLYDDGSISGHVLNSPAGLTLTENQHIEEKLELGDNTLYKAEFDISVIDAWINDTQGKKHKIKDVRKCLEMVWSKEQ